MIATIQRPVLNLLGTYVLTWGKWGEVSFKRNELPESVVRMLLMDLREMIGRIPDNRLELLLKYQYDPTGARTSKKVIRILEDYLSPNRLNKFVSEWQKNFVEISADYYIGKHPQIFAMLGHMRADAGSCFGLKGAHSMDTVRIFAHKESFVILILPKGTEEIVPSKVLARCWGVKMRDGVVLSNFYYCGIHNVKEIFVEVVRQTWFPDGSLVVSNIALKWSGVYTNGGAIFISPTKRKKRVTVKASRCTLCPTKTTQTLCGECSFRLRKLYMSEASCEICGRLRSVYNLRSDGATIYCVDCERDMLTCRRCKSHISPAVAKANRAGGDAFCDSCFDAKFRRCFLCEDVVDVDDYIYPLCKWCHSRYTYTCAYCGKNTLYADVYLIRLYRGSMLVCSQCTQTFRWEVCTFCRNEFPEEETIPYEKDRFCASCAKNMKIKVLTCSRCESPTTTVVFEGNKIYCKACK